jgi:hypothetical protein
MPLLLLIFQLPTPPQAHTISPSPSHTIPRGISPSTSQSPGNNDRDTLHRLHTLARRSIAQRTGR